EEAESTVVRRRRQPRRRPQRRRGARRGVRRARRVRDQCPGSAQGRARADRPARGLLTGLERYRRVFAAPHVAGIWLATTIARLPIGINGLAYVLAIRHVTGSY